MKIKYRVALWAVVALLMIVGGKARAMQVEISVGQTKFQKSNDTDWWQTGPASEGFGDDFRLMSSSYSVGLSKYFGTTRVRAGYANLGSVSSRAVATNYDEQYDAVHQRCVASGCEMVSYVGRGSVDGYYLTVAPEYRMGKWAVYAEAGAWVYWPKFAMFKSYADGHHYQLQVNSGTEVGPVFGFGVRHESMTLSFRAYKSDHNGQLPAIYQGYTTEVALGWSFK